MCPAPTTMTDSIIATQRTRDRTFFCRLRENSYSIFDIFLVFSPKVL